MNTEKTINNLKMVGFVRGLERYAALSLPNAEFKTFLRGLNQLRHYERPAELVMNSSRPQREPPGFPVAVVKNKKNLAYCVGFCANQLSILLLRHSPVGVGYRFYWSPSFCDGIDGVVREEDIKGITKIREDDFKKLRDYLNKSLRVLGAT